MPIQRFVVGPMGNNTYIVFDEASKEAAIVDPAKGTGPVLVWMKSHGLLPKYVLNTHGHSDHTFDNGLAMDGADASLMIGEPDEAMLEALAEGDWVCWQAGQCHLRWRTRTLTRAGIWCWARRPIVCFIRRVILPGAAASSTRTQC